ncbi:hypothetical protein GA0115246_108425, partial [Streptomyces sp. SolWspMP-sol7th]
MAAADEHPRQHQPRPARHPADAGDRPGTPSAPDPSAPAGHGTPPAPATPDRAPARRD